MDKRALLHDDDLDEADKHNFDKESLQNEIISMLIRMPKDKIILMDKIISEIKKSDVGGV